MKRITRVGLLTSGGDCQGLNAAIRGVGKALFQFLPDVEIYGFYDGYRGLIERDYKFMDYRDFSGIIDEGGTILGTSRQKFVPGKMILDDDGNDAMPSMIDTYNRLNLDCIVVMGGNGTQKGAKLMMDAGMNVVTLPKTIDNDIWGTEITFGFQSAVDIATQVIDYIHPTASAHRRIFVVELMGRDAGWLTLQAGIAGGADGIIIPEIPYELDKIVEGIEHRKKFGRYYSILAVAEGAVSVTDKKLSENERRKLTEEMGHSTISYRLASELKAATGQSTRVTVPGHFQRGGPPSPYDRVLATRFGVAAARLIRDKQYGHMVAIQDGVIVPVPLDEAASRTKFLDVNNNTLIETARDIGIFFGD